MLISFTQQTSATSATFVCGFANESGQDDEEPKDQCWAPEQPMDGLCEGGRKSDGGGVQIKMWFWFLHSVWICRVARWECIQICVCVCVCRRLRSPPVSLQLGLFHSSDFIFICACIWAIISCMRLSYREKRKKITFIEEALIIIIMTSIGLTFSNQLLGETPSC